MQKPAVEGGLLFRPRPRKLVGLAITSILKIEALVNVEMLFPRAWAFAPIYKPFPSAGHLNRKKNHASAAAR
jgi:hypothetical protein